MRSTEVAKPAHVFNQSSKGELTFMEADKDSRSFFVEDKSLREIGRHLIPDDEQWPAHSRHRSELLQKTVREWHRPWFDRQANNLGRIARQLVDHFIDGQLAHGTPQNNVYTLAEFALQVPG